MESHFSYIFFIVYWDTPALSFTVNLPDISLWLGLVRLSASWWRLALERRERLCWSAQQTIVLCQATSGAGLGYSHLVAGRCPASTSAQPTPRGREERLRQSAVHQPQHNNNPAGVNIVTLASSELRMSGSWKQGLCNCCGDCGVCMCGLCCEPCLVYR